MKYLLPLFVIYCSLCVVFAGCNRKVGVYGKVTFSDGQPLTKGSVIFQNEQIMVEGRIQKDGTYQMGMLADGDGCQPGNYQVYISSAVTVELAPKREKATDPIIDDKVTLLIDMKMTQPDTSGLTCVVEKGMKLPFNITVEPPK
jgi:hypothetical protein